MPLELVAGFIALKVRGVRRLAERPLADQFLERLPELEVHVVGAKPDPSREAARPPRA